MTETYVLVGHSVHPSVLLIGPVLIAIIGLVRWRMGKRPALAPAQIGIGVVLLLWALMMLPLVWFGIAAAVACLASGVWRLRQSVASAVVSWILGLFFLVLNGVLAASMMETVTLDETTITHEWNGRRSGGLREGISVIARTPPQGFPPKAWHYWSIRVRASDTPPPHIFGSGLYWGPNGFIRGGDLGHRIAEWGGTQVKYAEWHD